MDKPTVKSFIDWPNWRGGIRWIAACGGCDEDVIAFRRGWRRGRWEPFNARNERVIVAPLMIFETPRYPWTVARLEVI